MIPIQLRLILIQLSVWMCLALNAQTYDFKNYDSSVGLPQNYIYSLVQDHHGYVWIATGQGLVRYDGFEFKTFTNRDSLADDAVQKLFLASNGYLWTGHSNGNLSYFDGELFHSIEIDITNSIVHDIAEDEVGNIWAVDQNRGLFRISPQKEVRTFFDRKIFGRNRYYSVAVVNASEILVGTADGLLHVKFSEGFDHVEVNKLDQIPNTQIECIKPSRANAGQFWIGTQDAGFYKYSVASQSSNHIVDNRLCLLFNIEGETIKDIYEDRDGNILVASWGHGVIKLLWDPYKEEYSNSFNFSTANGLSADFVNEILCDRENNYWFATYGGGVASLIRDYFIFYNLEQIGFKNQKVYSTLRTKNELWIGLEKGLLKTDPLCFTNIEYYDSSFGIPLDKITGLYQDDNDVLWVATQNKGLYYRLSGKMKFNSYPYSKSTPGNMINDILGFDDTIYLATNEGIYILNTADKSQKYLDMSSGLSHNTINFLYKDSKGVIWVGPKNNGICSIDNNDIERHKLMAGSVNVADMTEDRDGNKWLATENLGILKYAGDSLVKLTMDEGLKKNYCYSIECDRMNRLWICHHPGLSCIDLREGQSRIFDYENNMIGDFSHVTKDQFGELWFSSSEGVVNYLPQNDQKNMIPPLLNLSSVVINDIAHSLDKDIILPYPYGKKKYNLKFDFIGISFENPLEVRYEAQLLKDEKPVEKHSDQFGWEDIGSTNFVKYEYLVDGEYYLRIRAFNADGVVSTVPISRKIVIKNPFWQSWWFIVLCISVFIIGIYLMVKYRERKLVQQKQVLQREVASQTVVLRNQKAEIERKNRDITDSINYAKKIQSSILPPLDELDALFPGSFVYYVPRDIVSGDFYWFNRTGDTFIICCADCTGHGVPGAFMSMIGTTILNDISKLEEINSPADMLERLDGEIKMLLQTKEGAESKDGMDISVIEIHIPTLRLRIASARRPVYMKLNNELVIYKGNRRSIGDDDLSAQIGFVNVEYKAVKGDQIFLFSDGYPDQFGGPLGKKFMTVGVRNLIEQIYEMDKEQQLKTVKENFEKWQGEYEQVDDVLFMGIRL